MKKQVIIALALFVSVFTFAQKKEVKALEKAVKKDNYAEAKALATQLDSQVSAMDDNLKEDYYLAAAQAYYANGTSNNVDTKKAIENVLKVGSEGTEFKRVLENDLLTKANNFYSEKKFNQAAEIFKMMYAVNPDAQDYLYYTAVSYIGAQDFDNALESYLELDKLGYTGVQTEYYATNKASGEEEVLAKNVRDNYVRLGTHEKPGERQTESRASEITRNIALIYINKGEKDKALAAIEKAKQENPDDVNLLINEANIYFEMGEEKKFQSILQKAIEKEPNNADLHYNVGVIYMNNKEIEKARESFDNVMRLDPTNANAALNLSTSYLEEGNSLVEQMNSLGNSRADDLKYEELKKKKASLFEQAAQTLVDFKNNNSKVPNSILEQLKNIYNALGETAKAKAITEELEGN
ncbi:tetratricopeptide repeat protein [Mesoflavibacter sp. CH_XMU1404-2]|uniref:tetratricopeptide repeat protein n=1 Tax=Mesoflavibacter sp. CH_XMU1404-2 TaxID=3107766 RepID=UPI00300AB143